MRRVGAGFLAAVLALAGCKSNPFKPNEKEPSGTPTAGAKNKTPDWLAGIGKLPGKGTEVPKAGTWAKPGEPTFDTAKEAQGVFAGRVIDPSGKGVKRAFIKIEPADAPPGVAAAPQGIMTNEDGFFMTQGLTPGVAYVLTAEAEQDGKTLMGIVQAKAPSPTIAIQLRDDMHFLGQSLRRSALSWKHAHADSDQIAHFTQSSYYSILTVDITDSSGQSGGTPSVGSYPVLECLI